MSKLRRKVKRKREEIERYNRLARDLRDDSLDLSPLSDGEKEAFVAPPISALEAMKRGQALHDEISKAFDRLKRSFGEIEPGPLPSLKPPDPLPVKESGFNKALANGWHYFALKSYRSSYKWLIDDPVNYPLHIIYPDPIKEPCKPYLKSPGHSILHQGSSLLSNSPQKVE